MKARIGWYTLGAAIFSAGLTAGGAACRAEGTTSTATAAGPGGTGSGGGATTGVNVGGATGTTTTTGAAGGGTGGSTGCDGQVVTVQDVTTEQVGPDVDVRLEGVVAMSQKFLVSKSSNTGSCLWGVFVSAPGLTETAANTGILILSYGTDAVIPDGGNVAYCPKLGEDPAGDNIPDDTLPGDVLDVVGKSDYFLLNQCATEPNGSQVAQRQVSRVCSAVKTGTAPVPAAHVLTPEELDRISSPTDMAFHNQWGGVKVRATGPLTPVLVNGMATDMYGVMVMNQHNGLRVANRLYDRPYSDNFCHKDPVFAPDVEFNSIEGIHYLNFCTWGLDVNDKCADFDPASEDCAGDAGMPQATCPPDL